MSQVKKNIAWLMCTQISSYIFPLLTLPYLMRVLGMHNYGVYALILAYSQYLLLLVDFGYNLTATRSVALYRNDIQQLSIIFWTTMCAKAFLCGIGFFISFITVFFIGKEYLVVLLVAYFSIIGNAFFPIWLFQGLENMKYMTITSVISRSLVLVLTFLFVNDNHDLLIALAIYSLTFVVPSFLLNLHVWQKKIIGIYKPTIKDVIKSLKLSSPVFISNFAISFYTNFNSILLSRFEPISVVGNYYAADRVRIAVQTLLTPVSQAIYPRVCDSQKKSLNNLLIRFGCMFILFGLLLTLAVYIFSITFSNYYFGLDNIAASHYLSLMSPVIFIVSIAMVFGHWFMAGNGYNKELSFLYTTCSVMHLAYSYPIVKFFGVEGLIIASLSTQLIIAFMMFVFFMRKRT